MSALRFFNQFLGGSGSEDIVFELNTNYDVNRLDAQERAQLILEWQSGAISWNEMRDSLRLSGIVTQEDEVAKAQISRELEDIPVMSLSQ